MIGHNHAITLAHLLRGDPADALNVGALPDDLRALAQAAINANGQGRSAAFQTAIAGRADADDLLEAILGIDPDADVEAETPAIIDAPDCPALPEIARIDPARGDGVSKWLDNYVGFSRRWSPRAFDGFHEACALWLLSTVAARRVVLHLGKPHYTPLYVALVARTSLFAKSTTADIAIDAIRAAGLDWMLAADDSTPQKFIKDLTACLPENFDELPGERREWLRLRLALTAQRGWFYEEFGQHLDAMNRSGGVMADFRGMLRRFDDCKVRYEYATLARGTEVVERPYLALLASLTPADLRPFARRGSAMWNDGFWARFAFVVPNADNLSRERFPNDRRSVPPALVDPIRIWHDRLGVPDVTISDMYDAQDKPTGRKHIVIGAPHVQQCELAPGVRDAFYAYHDGLLDLVAQSQNTDLDGNYARFAEKALRVAMLLASLENDGRIEMAHWARGQTITERWRSNLHALFAQVNQPDANDDADKEHRLLSIVQKLETPTAADVARYMRGMSSGEAKRLLDSMAGAGMLVAQTSKRTTRYTAQGRVDK